MTRDEEDEVIYAVALLTRSELTSLGPALARAWPVGGTPCFGELLAAVDDADRAFWRRNRHLRAMISAAFSGAGLKRSRPEPTSTKARLPGDLRAMPQARGFVGYQDAEGSCLVAELA